MLPIFILCKLRIIKRAVKTALLHQLIMVSLFGDLTVLQNENKVCILNGGETMCDDKASAPRHQCIHGFLNLDLRTRVNIGGCFVKDQHRGIGEHRTGNGDELSLTLGDIDALIGKNRVIAIGQMLDIRVDASFAAALTSSIVAFSLPYTMFW